MAIGQLGGDSGFSRTELIKILNDNNVDNETRKIILFNFDSCDSADSTGEKDGVLKKDALKNFRQFMEKNQPLLMDFMNFKSDAMESFESFRENAMQRFNDFRNNAMASDNKSSAEPENSPKALTVRTLKAPATGDVYAEVNADGTTSQYNLKDRTVTLYDKDGNKLRTSSMDKSDEVKSQPKESPSKKLTQQEIDAKLANLKPGESYSYTQKSEAKTGVGFMSTLQTVTWKRNEDGTLQSTVAELMGRKAVKLTTVYSSDRSRKISEQRVNEELKLVNNVNYDDNGKPKNEVMNLSGYSNTSSMSLAGLLLRQMKKNANSYSSSEVRNVSGDVILSFKNGAWYNSKGKEVDPDKAYDILAKQNDNNNLGDFVRNC